MEGSVGARSKRAPGRRARAMPKRSMSYRAVALCIISTAQHARPNVMGQMDPFRAQFTNSSTFVTMNSTLSLPPSSISSTLEARVRELIWDFSAAADSAGTALFGGAAAPRKNPRESAGAARGARDRRNRCAMGVEAQN